MAEGDQVVAPLNRLIEEFLRRGEPVFRSRDWHPQQTKHFEQYGGTWPVHCVQNTKGAEFHPDLIDDIHLRTISKGMGDEDSYSAFDGTDLSAATSTTRCRRSLGWRTGNRLLRQEHGA